MADTTSINTGNKNGISNRLAIHLNEITGADIYILECQFHINEILMKNVVKYVDGKPVAPDRMQQDSVYNRISKIRPQTVENVPCSQLRGINVTARTIGFAKSVVEWYSGVGGRLRKIVLPGYNKSFI